MIVTFFPGNKKVQAEKGDRLIDIAAKVGFLIDGSCGGRGNCGRCKIQVMSCMDSNPDATEAAALTEKEIESGHRLACRLTVEGDLQVSLPGASGLASRKSRLTYMPEDFVCSSTIKKHYIQVEEPTLANPESDTQRIIDALSGEGYSISPKLLAGLPAALEAGVNKVTVTEMNKQVIAIEPGDTTDRCFGIAYDIGTTTVVGILWDINKGVLLDVCACTNPQSAFGADVISRINYCMDNVENLNVLKEKIRNCLGEITVSLAKNCNIEVKDVYEATIVGNMTMSHLFMGVNPVQLARAPFAPVFTMPVDMEAEYLGLAINPLANVYLLPNIAGHVGSDTVGVLLASGIMEKQGLNLAIDIGTNGEIVLCGNGQALVCSTAAGPAFEGAAIFQGMRAAEGAIEGMDIIDGEVVLSVIGDEKPVGICGSGLIDAVARLLDAGILNHTGKFMDPNTAGDRNLPQKLSSRLRKGATGIEFVLAWGVDSEDIVITQKDVREVQLAKGAIRSGISILTKALGAEEKNLDSIILAGAFGNYIKKESALRIGLLPDIPTDRVISLGNAAGTGASMALLSKGEREKALIYSGEVRHIELASCPDFQNEFINAMGFPLE